MIFEEWFTKLTQFFDDFLRVCLWFCSLHSKNNTKSFKRRFLGYLLSLWNPGLGCLGVKYGLRFLLLMVEFLHMAGICWHLTLLRSCFCIAGCHCWDGVGTHLQILEGNHLLALYLAFDLGWIVPGLNVMLQCDPSYCFCNPFFYNCCCAHLITHITFLSGVGILGRPRIPPNFVSLLHFSEYITKYMKPMKYLHLMLRAYQEYVLRVLVSCYICMILALKSY